MSDTINTEFWDGLSNLLDSQFSPRRNESRYQFAANENNRDQVVQAALEALQKVDPEHGNFESAIVLADKMIAFSRKKVEDSKIMRSK